MTFIHIKKLQTGDPETGFREVFAVPSVAIATPQGRKLIPNPSGAEASLFNSLEEAEEAVKRAGFDYIFEGKRTYTLNQGGKSSGPLAAVSANPLDDAVPLLLQQLQEREPSVVANAAFALGMLKAPTAMHALAGILGHDDPAVRKNAADALARYGARAVPVLRDAYRDAQNAQLKNASYVRLAVIGGFLEMSQAADGRLVELLLPLAVEALQDESWLVRSQAALVVARAAEVLEDEKTLREQGRKKL